MKNFTIILTILFCGVGLLALSQNTLAITFGFASLGALIILICFCYCFGFIRGLIGWLILLALPVIIIFIMQRLNGYLSGQFTTLAGIELMKQLPIMVLPFFAALTGSAIFFSRYIIISKSKSSAWHVFNLMLASLILILLTLLIILPPLTAQTLITWNSSGSFYAVPIFGLAQIAIIILVAYLIIYKLINFKLTTNPFYIRTGSFVFVGLIIFFGLMNLRTAATLPLLLAFILLFYYLVRKYNYYKTARLLSTK